MKLKIIHYADIQVEIRTSGTGSQRLFEFTDSLRRMESIIKDEAPQIVVIAGDVFEFQATNGEETKLFGEHLNTITQYTDRVIIIPGNHDIRQRGIALNDIDTRRNISDSIHSVVGNIQNDKISYYDETGFYDDPVHNVTWAVWSQRTKWNMDGRDRPYSPWDIYEKPLGNIIELFHDPRKGAIGFNRKSYEHFEEYPITLDSFQANTILAGDIHAPEIIWFGNNEERLFTYSSSLVMRNFGEGDYYDNTHRYVLGNLQHGYNIVEYDTDNNRATSCTFHRLTPTVNRYTIKIDDKFNFDIDIKRLVLDDPAPMNKVRIECQTSIKKFTEYQGALVEHLQKNYNIDTIEFTYGADVIEMDTEYGDDDLDVSELMSTENLRDLSKKYIDTIVDKTKSIDESDKEEAKELINGMFMEELLKINFDKSREVIGIHRLVAKNFMNFGTDVLVDFDSLGRIVRISGTNGLGKTTIFRAIKWVLTDKMDAGQNDRNKKENYFAVFNDHSGLDEVFVQLDFTVNKDMHTLSKTLTREWKRGKSSKDNNIDDLRTTPKLAYQLTSQTMNSDNTEEVENYLKSIISYEELDRFVFVDMDTLTNLIKMPSEDLGGLILEEIGLDFVNDLLLNYDDVRDSKLDKLKKPSEEVDVLIDRLTTLKGKIELLNIESSEKVETCTKLVDRVNRYKLRIDEATQSLHKVETVEVIQREITLISDKLVELIGDRSTIQEQLTTKQANVGSLEKLNDEKILLSGVIQTKRGEVDNNVNNINNLEQNIDSKKGDAKKLLEREQENQQNKIGGEEGKISKLELKIAKIDLETAEEKQAVKDSRQNTIDGLQKMNGHLHTEHSKVNEKRDLANANLGKLEIKEISLTKDIESNAEKIKNLSNEKTCTACKQDLNETHLEHIRKDVEELQTTISKDEKLLDFVETKIAEMRLEAISHFKEANSINIKIEDNRNEIRKIQREITEGVLPDNILELIVGNELRKDGIRGEIITIQNTIESIKRDIVEHVKQSIDYKEIIQQIQDFRSRINVFKESNIVIEDSITKEQQNLNNCNGEIVEVVKTNEAISNLKELLNDKNNAIVILESKCKEKQADLKLAHINVPILANIKEIETNIDNVTTDIEDKKNEINELSKQVHTYTVLIEQTITDIEDARRYRVFSSSMRLYKQLLGKKGLPVFIFSHIIPMLNKKMNELLNSVKFRLMFDKETLTLKFHDIEKGVSRSVKFTSGMENTIIGLTLVHVIRKINNSKKFDAIFIDEISGKLNSGKDLEYDAPNYQKIVSDFLVELSKDMKVFIVDHVLELDSFDVISVYPEDNGTANVKVYHNMADADLKILNTDMKLSA